jgi:hypothetical protein
MECPQTPDPRQDRITQAAERVRAATARVSRAQVLLTEAQECLARAPLALAKTTARDIHDPPADDDPMKLGETQ